jgi:hypothetical protein
MSLKWKILSGFAMGFLFLPLLFMVDKYVGPGAGTAMFAMFGVGICVAIAVWMIDVLGKIVK